MEDTSSSSSPAILTSLPLLDAIRDDPNATWTREPGSNLDVLSDDVQSDSDGDPVAICHLDGMFPFSQGEKRARQDQFEEATAMALAAHHLNVGDGSVVPQVEGLNARCPIRFTVGYADTEYMASKALEHIINVTGRRTDDTKERIPCAFIGAYRSSISTSTSILTGLQNYPQISAASTSADLDDTNQYPLFGRTIPSDHGNAVPIILFMRWTLGIKHLAVINVNDSYGNSLVIGLRLAAEIHAPDMVIHQSTVDGDIASMRSALSSVKATDYRYIFAIVFTEETHDTLLSEAYKMGLAGTGKHQWLFGDSFVPIGGRVLEANSPLNLAYRGVGMLEATGGIPGVGLDGYETFLKLLADVNNPEDLEYLFSIFPQHDDPVFQEGIDNFVDFLTPVTGAQASFVYEAAIALGLAACQSTENAIDSDKGIFLDGKDHFNNVVNSVFQGVNGDVVFDRETGSKEYNYTLYKVTNFVDEPVPEEGVVRFKETYTHVFKEGAWRELSPFIFNDGSTVPLGDIPPASLDNTVINLATRATVLFMCGIVLILGIGLMVWTRKHKKTRVVLASQPFFLLTLCVGVMIMGCTIIPLSIDHGVASLDGCTVACTSVLWLGAMGFSTTISALFTKTHRINIILSNSNRMQRIRVTIRDVAKPMITLISMNAIILSIMSGLSPTDYELIVESYDEFGRPEEIRGQCTFKESLPYVLSVCVINFGALLFTIAEAFKARNLSTEFAESIQIFRALLTITITIFVGGPVLLLARDNANTFLFVASAIIFVGCLSVLLLMFVPKIRVLRESLRNRLSRARLHISGLETGGSGLDARSVTSRDNGDGDGDDTEEFTGIKILTTKTPEELLKEIKTLKMLLRRARAEKREEDPAEEAGMEMVEDSSNSSFFQVQSKHGKKSILEQVSFESSQPSQSNGSKKMSSKEQANNNSSLDSSADFPPVESSQEGQPPGSTEEVESSNT